MAVGIWQEADDYTNPEGIALSGFAAMHWIYLISKINKVATTEFLNVNLKQCRKPPRLTGYQKRCRNALTLKSLGIYYSGFW
ncbi:hypothetical protein A1356_02430 [Methylomonas koyamae]|uniref:Uncharacterized protein n=1 Tax=Methylomonas koyamae TaxID=702114 RepID=A0AA91D9Q3_9GAMM|nr:hypothetical protein A1356_02430 [Methylomonas koyamae]